MLFQGLIRTRWVIAGIVVLGVAGTVLFARDYLLRSVVRDVSHTVGSLAGVGPRTVPAPLGSSLYWQSTKVGMVDSIRVFPRTSLEGDSLVLYYATWADSAVYKTLPTKSPLVGRIEYRPDVVHGVTTKITLSVGEGAAKRVSSYVFLRNPERLFEVF